MPCAGRVCANLCGWSSFLVSFYDSAATRSCDCTACAAGRAIVMIVAALGIVAIAMSRIAIGVHTSPEVAVGLMVGLLSVGFFAVARGRGPAPRLVLPLILVLLVGGAAALYGRRAGAEDLIRHLAAIFYRSTGLC